MKPELDDVLLNQLQSLQEEVPPMPEDLHAGWMQQLEEEAMKETRTSRPIRPWLKALSVAAAAIFVIGGTLLTRPLLRPDSSSRQRATIANSATEADSWDATEDYAEAEIETMVSYDAANGILMAKSADQGGIVSDRKVIRNVELTITTREYDQSFEQLQALCAAHAGSIAYMSDTTGSRSLHTAYLTLRIPAENLDAFLQDASEAGAITRKEISASDVTESYQDTQARLNTQQAKMERLQELLRNASDISDLLAVENEIADTQYLIDSYQASLNNTDRQVAYSTVDITLREEKPEENLTAPELSLGERLLAAIQAGWDAFTEFLEDAAVFLVAALPFLAVVALLAVILHIARKKHRQ